MAYNAVAQKEHDVLLDADSVSASPPASLLTFQPLRMDFSNLGSGGLFMDQYEKHPPNSGLNKTAQSILSRTKVINYNMLEAEDYSDDSPSASPAVLSEYKKVGDNSEKMEATRRSHCQATKFSGEKNCQCAMHCSPEPIVRTASSQIIPLRHPTPDLHTLQGALVANVEHLEKTAEKLSMTSSIDDAIRQLHNEQKRSDSRRSSILASSIEAQNVTRQTSSSSSIVDVNSAARSGGFSPGGYNMISPRQSMSTSNRVRSASKGSRFSSRPEPELEGRPLDFFANTTIPTTSPIVSRAASIAEQSEDSPTLTRPIVESTDQASEQIASNADSQADRPTTSASATTYEQAQRVFSDFDGEHFAPELGEPSTNGLAVEEPRVSSVDRPTLARPQSYADPETGQQMVYYPAPVPMMLNLPQRLSKVPSKETRDKRRTQVLSAIPPAARQSAIWLPDVLEDEGDGDLASKDAIEAQEYMPQHQRRTMGGRRSMLDLQHLPPQLRASAYFEQPGLSQTVKIKGESAIATLDSILDASAFAPVSAFTDHAFAGRLGSEVYGTSNKRASKPITKIPESEQDSKKLQKRKSFSIFLGLGGNDTRDSDGNEQRSTVSVLGRGKEKGKGTADPEDADEGAEDANVHFSSGVGASNVEEPEDNEQHEAQPEDVYHGPPTTLLAELQLRKQHQQQRTRPAATVYPNGMRSTLLELDTVAQVEKRARKQKRVNLAWEDPNAHGIDSDGEENEDVPLGMLFPINAQAQQERARPLGLMERREMEDNEPLSRRRDRLHGKPRAAQRASTMTAGVLDPEDEDETLAQRIQRLKAQGGTVTGLPTARPVSGDFTSELMSQFGGEAMEAVQGNKGKAKEISVSPGPEEEETLGQRRKRLQAERAAREKEVNASTSAPVIQNSRSALKQRLSMADVLGAHPAAGASRQSSRNLDKLSTGLLGLHEQRRASTLLDFQNSQPGHRTSTFLDLQEPKPQPAPRANTLLDFQNSHPVAGGFMNGMYNNGAGGTTQPQPSPAFGTYGNTSVPANAQLGIDLGGYAQQQQMMYPFSNPYNAMGYGGMGYAGYGGYAGYVGNGMMGVGGLMGARMGMEYNIRTNPMAASMLQMANSGQPLNQGQIDMVERWRQSVMQ
jgi:hypothetical protein